jgi:hypothetical protein
VAEKFLQGNMTGQADSERYMNMARSSRGWAGNIALEDDIVSEATRTNEVIVGVAGPKQGYRNGWPASRIFRSISSICSQQAIKLLRVSYGPGHVAPYGDAGAVGQRGNGRGLCCLALRERQVAEISTIQDQFVPL